MKKHGHHQRGVAAVEFALILIPLVLLVFGTIEFSVMLYDKAVITNASREGARAAIRFSTTPLTDSDIETIVNTYAGDNLISLGGGSLIDTNVISGGDEAGDPITVSVSYTYNFLVLPNFISSLGPGIELQAETIMRREQAVPAG